MASEQTTDLQEIVAKMRELGVTRFKRGDLEIDLGPQPHPALVAEAKRDAAEQFDNTVPSKGMGLTAAEQVDLFGAVVEPIDMT